jgi:hypothetical protein
METSSTKQDTVAKTIALAMHAVAAYMLDQQLPAPRAIRRPRPRGHQLRIDLFAADLEAWVQATGADYMGTETRNRFVTVTFVGRVPSPLGDVAVELRIAQSHGVAPRSLHLVPAGGAA